MDTSRPVRLPWPLLALALVCAVLVQTGLGLSSNQDVVPGTVDSDAHLLFHANRTFLGRCVRRGELPLWNPHNLLGQPAYAAGQTQATYPPAYLLYPWMRAGRALFADFTLHLVLLGLGMALLARTCGSGPPGAWVAALAVALSPLMVYRLHAGHVTVVATMAWLPYLAAGLVRVARGEAGIGLAAAALGLACHAGHIQELYYFLAFGLPLWVAGAWLRSGARAVARGALAVALGLALGAPQLVPMRELAAVSSRGATSLDWVTEYASRATDLPALLGPEVFGDRAAVPYWGRWKVWEPLPAFGFAALAMGALALVVAPGRFTAGLAALVALAVALALGRELPLSAWAFHLVPGFARFRDPARVLLVALLPLGLLAGAAADALVERTARGRALAGALVMLAIAALLAAGAARVSAADDRAAAAAMEAVRWPEETFDRVDVAAIAPAARRQVAWMLGRDVLIAALLGALAVWSSLARPARLGVWVLLGAIALEYLDGCLPFARTNPPPLLSAEAQDWLAAGPPGSRVDLDRGSVPTLATLLEVETPGGSASLMTRWTEAFLNVSQGRSPAGSAGGTVELVRYDGPARLMGVSRVVRAQGDAHPPPGLEHRNSPARLRRFATAAPFPRAWVVRKLRRCSTESEELRALRSADFDPLTEAIVGPDAPAVPLAPGSGPRSPDSESVRIVRAVTNRVDLWVRLESPGVVVLADSFDPGWSARSDGTPTIVMRADHALRAVALPAGIHTVTLVYRPPGLWPGVLAAAAAALFIGLLREI